MNIIALSKFDIIVLICLIIISVSGIFINIIKNQSQDKILIEDDKYSLSLFRFLIPFSFISSYIVYLFHYESLQFSISYIHVTGFILFAIGLIIRWISVLQLGNSFTVKVSILKSHKLIKTGIYKFIRHPSYTGLIIYNFGIGFLMSNYLSFFILIISAFIVVLVRIRIEEKVLIKHFDKEYLDYKSKSYYLFPFVY